jgi:hypothetical protein
MPETNARGGARAGAGRKPKPKIELKADKGIASTVLAMDGPPNHERHCKCDPCTNHRRRKECQCEPKDGVLDPVCAKHAEHKVCHCELCGWWEALLAKDIRLRKETRQYLTDRRDGKPAQGVFLGDTRESARELDFGDLPQLVAPGQSGAAGKPN